MEVKIYSCLLALILGWNATAEIIHQIIRLKESTSMPCPRPEMPQVVWSKDKVDILRVDGDRDVRLIKDSHKQYSSLADKSLHIFRASVSSTGRYYCNCEPAADLTVIPSGTSRVSVKVKTSVRLSCPAAAFGQDEVPSWRRETGGQSCIIRPSEDAQGGRFHVSAVDKALTVTAVRLDDSGLYFCDEEPAVFLDVITDEERKDTCVNL